MPDASMGPGMINTAWESLHEECYNKDLQTGFYLFKLGVLILES